jgi:hypothetical protein
MDFLGCPTVNYQDLGGGVLAAAYEMLNTCVQHN